MLPVFVTRRPGRYLASGSWDDTIRQWVAETGQSLWARCSRAYRHRDQCPLLAVGLAPSDSSYDQTIRQWVAETGETFGPVLAGHTGSVASVCYSPGRYLASSSWDKTIRQWVAETGQTFGPVLKGIPMG